MFLISCDHNLLLSLTPFNKRKRKNLVVYQFFGCWRGYLDIRTYFLKSALHFFGLRSNVSINFILRFFVFHFSSLSAFEYSPRAAGVSRPRWGAPENEAQQRKYQERDHGIANDADIPHLHIGQGHPQQPRQTEDATDSHKHSYCYLQFTPLQRDLIPPSSFYLSLVFSIIANFAADVNSFTLLHLC